jgi:hypothetical protein
VRKVLAVTATLAVGIALLSCSPRHRVVYLPPPPAYGPAPSAVFAPLPPPTAYSPAPSMRYGKSTYARSETSPQSDGHVVLQSSPRRAAVKTKIPDLDAKFKAAQAKAKKIGVENLTKDDIAGLSPAQLKVLRGY